MGDKNKRRKAGRRLLDRERYQLLNQLQEALELPMVVLGFCWLVLLLVELIWSLSPALQLVSNIIWGIFILDFIVKFILAPHKLVFLRRNIITSVSLALPALRLFNIARAFRLLGSARELRLVKVVGSINRGMRSLGKVMQRRAFGYVLGLTLVVTAAGSAGMYALEGKNGLETYGDAMWWKVMLLTSIGSD